MEVGAGFAVEPRSDCPHVLLPQTHLGALTQAEADGDQLTSDDKLENLCRYVSQHSDCEHEDCDEDRENWLCLQCGKLYCSRYRNGHMAEHCDQLDHENNDHCIAVSLCDLSFWCYKCDSYIQSPHLRQLSSKLYDARESFGQALSQLQGSNNNQL